MGLRGRKGREAREASGGRQDNQRYDDIVSWSPRSHGRLLAHTKHFGQANHLALPWRGVNGLNDKVRLGTRVGAFPVQAALLELRRISAALAIWPTSRFMNPPTQNLG
jgi:hypothetical protein